jgi:uncharacterized protein
LEYEWDDAKRLLNLRKHGVDLARVVEFAWDDIRESEDHRKNYGEHRWIAFGRIGDRVHVLIYTRRGDRIRVISLRGANDKETDYYEDKN